MRISVVIPAINEAAGIAAAVESARLAGAHEVWVVDGGSRDATASLASRLGARILTSEPSRGRQQNAGAAQAEGDVLLFLHADARLDAGCGGQIRAALEQPHVVGGFFRQRIDSTQWRFRWVESGNAWRGRVLQLPYGDQGLFVRRSVFDQVGGFPEEPLMEDVVLARRLRRAGTLVCLPGPLVVSARRWQKNGLAAQTLRNWTLLAAFQLGVPPRRLARFYPRHDL